MALENVIKITQFIDKATIWILAFIYDPATGELDDPTAIKVTVIDPDGTTQVDAAAMTKYETETGIYEYKYHKGATSDPMDKGQWRGRVDVIDGAGADAVISPKPFAFTVG